MIRRSLPCILTRSDLCAAAVLKRGDEKHRFLPDEDKRDGDDTVASVRERDSSRKGYGRSIDEERP